MFKRLIATVFVAALTTFGLVPAATAATSSDAPSAAVVKAHKFNPGKPDPRIDWDAPPADGAGGITTLRIDWD